MPFGYSSGFDIAELGTLSAAGVTASQLTAGATLSFQVVVASISTNVVIRFEGSLDDVSYFNLDARGADTTITSNGPTGYFINAAVKYVRMRLVSFSGGSPTVTTTLGCM